MSSSEPLAEPTVDDLAQRIVRAWDAKYSRPAFEGIDYQQARMAAQVCVDALVEREQDRRVPHV